MKIEYKTEGRVVLKNNTALVESVAVMWLKGSGEVSLKQGSYQIRLDKSQLLALADLAESIGNDLQPDMNSLPRCAE